MANEQLYYLWQQLPFNHPFLPGQGIRLDICYSGEVARAYFDVPTIHGEEKLAGDLHQPLPCVPTSLRMKATADWLSHWKEMIFPRKC